MITAWRLDPLPDFLLDHTLAEREAPARLREVVSRWVQLVGALWRWRDAATFAIRYNSDGVQTSVWFLATAHNTTNDHGLCEDVGVLLRSHGIPGARAEDPQLLTRPDGPLSLGRGSALAEVRQFETDRLWEVPLAATKHADFAGFFATLPERDRARCRLPFCWWAPGGPFLLPMEKLVSLGGPASITAYLEPTELRPAEQAYLTTMARVAQSFGDQQRQTMDQAAGTRRVDPAATLAGRILMANLRRLSDKPFLVTVHCATPASPDAARGLAGSIEAIVYEDRKSVV